MDRYREGNVVSVDVPMLQEIVVTNLVPTELERFENYKNATELLNEDSLDSDWEEMFKRWVD